MKSFHYVSSLKTITVVFFLLFIFSITLWTIAFFSVDQELWSNSVDSYAQMSTLAFFLFLSGVLFLIVIVDNMKLNIVQKSVHDAQKSQKAHDAQNAQTSQTSQE
jgi:TRAP-type C4-dicarboxylate transport system permease small subunit